MNYISSIALIIFGWVIYKVLNDIMHTNGAIGIVILFVGVIMFGYSIFTSKKSAKSSNKRLLYKILLSLLIIISIVTILMIVFISYNPTSDSFTYTNNFGLNRARLG